MTGWILTTSALIVAGLAYLLDRRINQAVSWSAEPIRSSTGGSTVRVTNVGTSKARGAWFELDPPPSRGYPDDPETWKVPRDVDRGAVALLEYHLALMEPPPAAVIVHWSRRLRRDGVWRSPI